MDFVVAATRALKGGGVEVYPKFLVCRSKDLMIRGGKFYAMWLEDQKRWTTDKYEAEAAIDNLLREKAEQLGTDHVAYLWDADTKSIDKWNYYCDKQQHDNWHMLNSKLVFDGEEIEKEDYVTARLPYKPEPGDTSAYDELIHALYSDDEIQKIEWMIGTALSGASRTLDKMYGFYGAPGTGKGTVVKIIQTLFPGHTAPFNAKALTSKNNDFALEQFKTNPLIAIDADSKLDKVSDNSILNSLVSHEPMMINEKFKTPYAGAFQSLLIVATNTPIEISDSKSGMIRRLIDINPIGNKIPRANYMKLMSDIKFELGAIAYKCLSLYEENPDLYMDYEPREMMSRSNDFYYFMTEKYFEFAKAEDVTLEYAYQEYKKFCEDAHVFPLKKKDFKIEFGDYFEHFDVRKSGKYNVYSGFLTSKFTNSKETIKNVKPQKELPWLNFDHEESILDTSLSDCPAQLTKPDGTPKAKWENVKTKLSDINTKELHYVKVPENHIVIDFDLEENGEKSYEKNLEAALKFSPTYAELSKSGKGIHLHYIYNGDVSKLSRFYDDKIEIKVFNGNSSLRRKLTKCNNLPVKPISANLPIKGDTKMLQPSQIKNERHLSVMIKKCLNKEYGSTVCNVDFIAKLFDDAYNKKEFTYDLTALKPAVYSFAANSSHQSAKCLKTYSTMHFKSSDLEENAQQENANMSDDKPIAFFDVEVFKNLFLICWKVQGPLGVMHTMINPYEEEVKTLAEQYRLIGFNNRSYDNHILYARMLGYSNAELYALSQRIISGSRNSKFSQAYNLSYTDVYDFAAASNKMSLKKFEIKLRLYHHELGMRWDEPVPENLWDTVAGYCGDDVTATEAVFDYLKADYLARCILADIAGMTPNDTTNSLSTKIIFGDNRHPQDEFNYRHMGEMTENASHKVTNKYGTFDAEKLGCDLEWTWFDEKGRPIFRNYKYEYGKSLYRETDPREGGFAWGNPGMYWNVPVLDVASMHPSSIEAEQLFGPRYTKIFSDIKQARVYIKRGEYDNLIGVLEGKLEKYIDRLKSGEISADDLSTALKTVINSVYGLTSAKFDNPFKDPRNVDNIVAKRGSLFMINLKAEVERRGFTVVHIKTDSIKIADATPEIIRFVMDYGHMYGYDFEHESTYDRICIVNDAVYIAKYAPVEWCQNYYGYIPGHNAKAVKKNELWTATGTEFQVPYVFKKLFSKEEIDVYDMAETKQATSAIYMDYNENNPDDHNYAFVGKVGMFSPVKPGCGGALLTREAVAKDGSTKYDSLSGAKDYRWLETTKLIDENRVSDIDTSYYDKLAQEAIEHINQYGDFYGFVA